uniref:Uncharacterized protein n=1 Tax=Anguilla anguilla TaxID=7936 RepID=A0A0E9UCG0_ANGAN
MPNPPLLLTAGVLPGTSRGNCLFRSFS